MKDYQREFIKFCLDHRVLIFGTFTLKSGRVSPYFFNCGLFYTGEALLSIGNSFARAIQDAGVDYDVLFGPAYKGIPLVCSTAIGLSLRGQQAPYAFNRKEVKDHAEGGYMVGAPLQGKVLVIDDVVTAGTAINEALGIIKAQNAKLAGVVLAIDRQEVAPDGSGKSAIQAIEEREGVPVKTIIQLDDIVEYLKEVGGHEADLAKIAAYREQYGVKSA
ncbi:hypothetical protein BZG36_01193 [Bifiguratus adelaidae]|uniref:orotate phosphoribosyltransferase n=1 Tax=Bifiguratus adelaidae TaxID=1938954 RepID=A0A261Y5M0_9FUNG|nr:hypothetical protein BZG36_01193 [Bifiguratus adelaidae]